MNKARTENGSHLDEEEREAMPDFIKSATLELRHELGMKWLKFYAEHEATKGIDNCGQGRRRIHRAALLSCTSAEMFRFGHVG